MKEGELKVTVPGLIWYTETPERRFTPLNSEMLRCTRLTGAGCSVVSCPHSPPPQPFTGRGPPTPRPAF